MASEDVRRRDGEVTATEQESEQLLVSLEKVGQRQTSSNDEKRRDRRARRSSTNFGRGEERAPVYEVEEGPRSSSEDSMGDSSESDMMRLGDAQAKQKVHMTMG